MLLASKDYNAYLEKCYGQMNLGAIYNSIPYI